MNELQGSLSNESPSQRSSAFLWYAVLWVARLTSIIAIIPILTILFGEPGTGPAGIRGWIYLLLFPIGFSFGYLIAWRWPVIGGTVSLVCMAASLVVIGRVLPLPPYLIWGGLSIPGFLFVFAGMQLRDKLTAET
jgi:hypothetical protein